MQKKHQKCSFLGSTRAQNCSKTKEFEKKFIFFEKYIPLISLLLFFFSKDGEFSARIFGFFHCRSFFSLRPSYSLVSGFLWFLVFVEVGVLQTCPATL
jgi:hypothetical protein